MPLLRHELDTLLGSARPVVLEVAQLTAPFTPAVEVLSRTLMAAGGWPTARRVVAGPDARFRAALRSTGTIRDVVVVDDVEQAAARLDDRPERVRRRLALRPGTAERRARDLVDRAGVEWDVPHLLTDARRITGGLVRAARGPSVLTITLGGEGLRIALRDFDTRHGLRVPADGRASGWGVTPRSDGNVAWALLAAQACVRLHLSLSGWSNFSSDQHVPPGVARKISPPFRAK